MIYHPFKNAKIISLQDQLGRIRPNFLADIMGVAGDSTVNIQVVRRALRKEGRNYFKRP
jgi:imidazolonepropionase-like amidohydrolase